ncbi:MAG: hypothetical protein ABF649_09155 [Bacillus sp. (in: firmicutes)]
MTVRNIQHSIRIMEREKWKHTRKQKRTKRDIHKSTYGMFLSSEDRADVVRSGYRRIRKEEIFAGNYLFVNYASFTS